MQARSASNRIVTVLAAAALLVLSTGMAWAAVYDYRASAYVPDGVIVAGTDLSGMTEAQARDAIVKSVSSPLLRPVTVTADGKDFTFDPSETVTVDVDAMVHEAFRPHRESSIVARLSHDLVATEVQTPIEPVYSVDTTQVAEWVKSVAKKVDRKASNADASVVGARVVVTPSRTGRKTAKKKAVAAITEAFSAERALRDENRSVTIPVKKVKPKVTEKRFEKTILVDLSERRVRLFRRGALEKTYPCAVGTAAFPTPTGEYEVTLKRFRPTWVNPGSDWGKDMPASIPPGPGNPLGTRAINISAPAIRFHGTENVGSVGTAASHGCMRMHRTDIEDLFERVEVGMKVFIVP